MIIGGYSMNIQFNGESVTVKHYESNQSFHLQGDDASQFIGEWENYNGENFETFLHDFEYWSLMR